MGSATLENIEPLVYKSQIKVPYQWAAGETGSFFLIQLRDHKKIFGARCPKCQKVYVPPRKNCPRCFCRCQDFVEVGPEGTLLGWAPVAYDLPIHPINRPIYGLILLKGATTAMLHLLDKTAADKLNIGGRVCAVFKEKREGNILDIEHFKLVE